MMKRKKRVTGILFVLLFLCFSVSLSTLSGCATTVNNVYSKNSGYLPVSLDNRDNTVIVIAKHKADGKFYRQHGSGVVVGKDENGVYILTNRHVVTSPTNQNEICAYVCAAKELGKKCAPSLVLATSSEYDLAIIYTDELKFKKIVRLGVKKELYQPGRIIYNWGFPKSYKKSLGYGYVSTPATPEPFFGKGYRLLGHIPNGPGTSGSGVFDMKTHKLIGIMQGHANYSGTFIMRYFIPSVYIKKFLDKNKIPYRE